MDTDEIEYTAGRTAQKIGLATFALVMVYAITKYAAVPPLWVWLGSGMGGAFVYWITGAVYGPYLVRQYYPTSSYGDEAAATGAAPQEFAYPPPRRAESPAITEPTSVDVTEAIDRIRQRAWHVDVNWYGVVSQAEEGRNAPVPPAMNAVPPQVYDEFIDLMTELGAILTINTNGQASRQWSSRAAVMLRGVARAIRVGRPANDNRPDITSYLL